MKYFIDTEFLEEPGSIQLISIGIKFEDGRKYYAVNKDAPVKRAYALKDGWVWNNVIKQIAKDDFGVDFDINIIDTEPTPIIEAFKEKGKSIEEIRADILEFIVMGLSDTLLFKEGKVSNPNRFYDQFIEFIKAYGIEERYLPEFYGYYADYDWVVFCWIFGRIKDLPKGFPMYCKDLKQMMDNYGLDKNWKEEVCPDPEGEHNALVDAEWNMNLYWEIMKFGNMIYTHPILPEQCFTQDDCEGYIRGVDPRPDFEPEVAKVHAEKNGVTTQLEINNLSSLYGKAKKKNIESANVEKIAFVCTDYSPNHKDEILGIFFLQYHNKSVFAYRDVPKSEYEKICKAESLGSYLHRNIKGNYSFVRIH